MEQKIEAYIGENPEDASVLNKEYILKTKEDQMQPNSLSLFNELLAYQILSVLEYKICPQQIDYLFIDKNFKIIK